jgi:hypothetical protein
VPTNTPLKAWCAPTCQYAVQRYVRLFLLLPCVSVCITLITKAPMKLITEALLPNPHQAKCEVSYIPKKAGLMPLDLFGAFS